MFKNHFGKKKHQEKQTTQDRLPKKETIATKKLYDNKSKMMAQQPSQSPKTLQKDLSHRIVSDLEETEEDLNANQQKVKESE